MVYELYAIILMKFLGCYRCFCSTILLLFNPWYLYGYWVRLIFTITHIQVPLSVPSQPSSPDNKKQATGLDTSFAAMTIAATTALPITTTQANPTFQHPASNLGAGLLLQQQQQTTSSTTITPAPVTIVRSSPIPPDPSQPLQQTSAPPSTTTGLSIHPPVGMTTASHETYQQTSSGLPTAPPTNFPMPMMMPPTISLGPTPILQSGTSHTPSSSAQQ